MWWNTISFGIVPGRQLGRHRSNGAQPATGRNTHPMDLFAVGAIQRPEARVPRAGDILVAAPFLTDPSFRRTVVYLLQHDEDGSAGVIVNRRFDGSLAGLDLPEWLLDTAVLHEGGPVAGDSLLALAATSAVPAPVRRAAGPDVCVVDLDQLSGVPAFAPVALFVGYAGWSPGQLAGELARHDWLVVDADPIDVLATDPENVWRRVLGRQRDVTRLWATLPALPTAN